MTHQIPEKNTFQRETYRTTSDGARKTYILYRRNEKQNYKREDQKNSIAGK